jgi:hypothetical protein
MTTPTPNPMLKRTSVLEEYEDDLEKNGETWVPDEALARATHHDLTLFDLFVKSFGILESNTVQIERDEVHSYTHIKVVRTQPSASDAATEPSEPAEAQEQAEAAQQEDRQPATQRAS